MNQFKFIIFVIIFSLVPLVSLAYSETTEGGQLYAEVSPQAPGSFTETSIHLISYEVDLGNSNIVWSINGKKAASAIGKTDFQFSTGSVGQKTSVAADVVSREGVSITKTISIIPAEVDLLWQSQNHTPPFYKGKALAGDQGTMSLVAMPFFIDETGKPINSSDLNYSWRINSNDPDTGLNKNTKSVSLAGLSSVNNILLEVSNQDGSIRASKLFIFAPIQPLILLYESSPLLGPNYSHALNGVLNLDQSETSLKVEPYFFGNLSNIVYRWGINNEQLTPSKDNKSELTIRQPSNSAGESLINISADSPYESAQKSITIKYSQATSGF